MSFVDSKELFFLSNVITSNTLLWGVTSEDVVNEDNSWYPYTYTEITCIRCGVNSGYYDKKWFGLFSLISYNYICDKCITLEKIKYL